MFRWVAGAGAAVLLSACLQEGRPVDWPAWEGEIGTVLLLGQTDEGQTWSEVVRSAGDANLALASPRALVYALGYRCNSPADLGVRAIGGRIALDESVGKYLRPPDEVFRTRLAPESSGVWEPVVLSRLREVDGLMERLPPFGEAICSTYRIELLDPAIDSESWFAIPLPGEEALVHLGPDPADGSMGRFVRVRKDGSGVGFELGYGYATGAVAQGDSLYLHGPSIGGRFVRVPLDRLPTEGEWDSPELPSLDPGSLEDLMANPFGQVCGKDPGSDDDPSRRVKLERLDDQICLASVDGSVACFDGEVWQGGNVSTSSAPEDRCIGGTKPEFTLTAEEGPRLFLRDVIPRPQVQSVIEVWFPSGTIASERIPARDPRDELQALSWVDGLGLIVGTSEFQFLERIEDRALERIPEGESLASIDRVYDIEPAGDASFLASGGREQIYRYGITTDPWTGEERRGFCAVAEFDERSAIPSVLHLVPMGDRWLTVPQDYFGTQRRLGLLIPDACAPGARFEK